MKRLIATAIGIGLITFFGMGLVIAAVGTSVPTLGEFNILEAQVADHESRINALEDGGEPTGPTAPPTGPTSVTGPPTGPTSPTGPTGPPDPNPADFTCNGLYPEGGGCQPQRTPAEGASDTYYEVDILNLDLQPGGVLLRQRFEVSQGWEFYDRFHYSCVTMYLQDPAGQRIAQVVYRTADDIPGEPSVVYAGINDRHGNEHALPADGVPSTCALSVQNEPLTEFEDKPAGLEDSVVEFVVSGTTQTTLFCPATSPRNADTWCEFEESDATPNHIDIEVYWERDLVVVITIDRMSPDVEFVT